MTTTDLQLRLKAIKEARSIEGIHPNDILKTAKEIYDFLAGYQPKTTSTLGQKTYKDVVTTKTVAVGNVSETTSTRETEKTEPAEAKEDLDIPDFLQNQEPKKDPYQKPENVKPPLLGKSLTAKQQETLNAINTLDEQGKAITIQSILKHLGMDDSQQSSINTRVVALEDRGLITRHRVGMRYEIRLAEDDFEEDEDQEDVAPAKQEFAIPYKPKDPPYNSEIEYTPDGIAKNIIVKLVADYVGRKIVYGVEDIPRAMSISRSNVVQALKELENEKYIMHEHGKVVPLKNANGSMVPRPHFMQ